VDRRTRIARITVAVIVAAVFFGLATNDVVYEVTSPTQFSWHLIARKAYSIVAFALVGFTADRAFWPSARPALRGALVVAIYSTVIEVAQAWHGSHEGVRWNIIDVLCGAVGGWLGVTIGRIASTSRARSKR
jgi:hypothetical protein